MFPPKQFLPQITCTAFVYASNWPADGKWRKCCFLLGMRRLSLLQLQALAFGVGRIWKCSFKLLWEDLEMQFQITLRGLSLLWLVANICFFFCWRCDGSFFWIVGLNSIYQHSNLQSRKSSHQSNRLQWSLCMENSSGGKVYFTLFCQN